MKTEDVLFSIYPHIPLDVSRVEHTSLAKWAWSNIDLVVFESNTHPLRRGRGLTTTCTIDDEVSICSSITRPHPSGCLQYCLTMTSQH